jgi:hypothetical protein
MTGEQVRSALRRRLLVGCLGSADGFLLEEVGIRHGVARLDFLVVNGVLHGFDVRNDRKTLRRLNYQVQIYNSVLDRVTLVAGDRYVSAAMNVIPNWWGIEVVTQGKLGSLTFSEVRNGGENPNLDKLAMAKFLWRAEALATLEELNAATGVRSKPRRDVYARLAECASLQFIQETIHFYLRQRNAARAARQ